MNPPDIAGVIRVAASHDMNSSCERAQTLRQSQARGAGRRDPQRDPRRIRGTAVRPRAQYAVTHRGRGPRRGLGAHRAPVLPEPPEPGHRPLRVVRPASQPAGITPAQAPATCRATSGNPRQRAGQPLSRALATSSGEVWQTVRRSRRSDVSTRSGPRCKPSGASQATAEATAWSCACPAPTLLALHDNYGLPWSASGRHRHTIELIIRDLRTHVTDNTHPPDRESRRAWTEHDGMTVACCRDGTEVQFPVRYSKLGSDGWWISEDHDILRIPCALRGDSQCCRR